MSTHTRAQLGRVIRLTLMVLVALIGTAPIQSAVAHYPAAATVVGLLEAAYRQLFPTVPLDRVESYTDHRPPPSGW